MGTETPNWPSASDLCGFYPISTSSGGALAGEAPPPPESGLWLRLRPPRPTLPSVAFTSLFEAAASSPDHYGLAWSSKPSRTPAIQPVVLNDITRLVVWSRAGEKLFMSSSEAQGKSCRKRRAREHNPLGRHIRSRFGLESASMEVGART